MKSESNKNQVNSTKQDKISEQSIKLRRQKNGQYTGSLLG
ncbi:hypothetical protein NIES4074_65110 (plasmid) [Cylindrospermum sp. NIES-4074]|nr:hypothetical protein NIES4074_65110 [Cylindrospermum sp. NIES-4074]